MGARARIDYAVWTHGGAARVARRRAREGGRKRKQMLSNDVDSPVCEDRDGEVAQEVGGEGLEGVEVCILHEEVDE